MASRVGLARRVAGLGVLAVAIAVVAASCSMEPLRTPSPTPTARVAIPSPTPSARPIPSSSPSSTPTATRTPTPTPSLTPTPSPTPPLPPAQPAPRVIALGQPVTLRPTVEVEVGGTPATLIFESVERDSRCPSDAVCVQAGSVTAVFDVWDGRAVQRGAVTLPSVGPATVTLGPLEVTLLAVEPVPTSTGPIKPFDYRAQVLVSRTAARGTSGIDGMVTLGPLCPVSRLEEPCPDRPFAATLLVRTAAGQTLGPVQSDASGRFTLDVPPGKYVIEPQLTSSGRLPFAGPVDVTVPATGRAAVTIAYDTGIR